MRSLSSSYHRQTLPSAPPITYFLWWASRLRVRRHSGCRPLKLPSCRWHLASWFCTKGVDECFPGPLRSRFILSLACLCRHQPLPLLYQWIPQKTSLAGQGLLRWLAFCWNHNRPTWPASKMHECFEAVLGRGLPTRHCLLAWNHLHLQSLPCIFW